MTRSIMTCAEARATLWPLRQLTLVAGRIKKAQQHIEGCSECQAYLEDSQSLSKAYENLAVTKAPLQLRDRVYAAIAEERASQTVPASTTPAQPLGWRRGLTAGWRVAAVAVIALGSGTLVARTSTTPDSGAVFVDDYLRRAVGQERIVTSDPVRVGRWLARELGLPMGPMQVAGLELEGAEICLLNGRRGAMIQYSLDGAHISHYLVPRRGATEREPAIGLEGRDADAGMPPLVTWSTNSLEQALVGELESERLLALARAAY